MSILAHNATLGSQAPRNDPPRVESGPLALPCRLRRTADNYRAKIRPDGGWGLAPGQASSLVNTAEVLAILEAAGVPYGDESVQRALSYLTENLEKHLNHPDRGPRTRYTAFTLLGLTEYPEGTGRQDVSDCIEFAESWLEQNNRSEGGWTSEAERSDLSLFATCIVVSALCRSGNSRAAIPEGVDCLCRSSLNASAWPLVVGQREPSPAVTGLAVLALFDADQPRKARDATTWLASRSEQWAARTEDARDELGTSWRHMSFGICARAVLRGGHQLHHPLLRPTLHHVDSLWDDREGLWSDGAPNGHLTVRGAYTTALLYQELRRNVLSFDPLSLAEALHPVTMTVQETQVVAVRLEDDGVVAIDLVRGESVELPLEQQLFDVVRELHAGGPMALRALCKKLSVNPPDIYELAASINHEVWSATRGVVPTLIEKRAGELVILGHHR